jgi:FtsZ-binding cell division protein ZapB
MLFSTLGLWGIAQQKNGAYASRLRDLEARHAKIEDDQKSFAQQSERNQRRIAALEVEKAELTQAVEELKVVVAERDELKKQLAIRTHERNDLRTQLDARTQERDTKAQELKQFAQELQALLGRVDSTIAAGQRPVGPTVAVPVSRRPE